MEDRVIIELYWQRDERAIAETAAKYGGFCHTIAMNLLGQREDAEECVNDTWHTAWRSIPPQRPSRLRAWLGRVVRNLALGLWNRNHAQKRCPGLTALLEELEDCVPAPQTVESAVEAAELTAAIQRWLEGLARQDRVLFLRRYWSGMPLKDLAALTGTTPDRLAHRMSRLRRSLRASLEQEGITV